MADTLISNDVQFRCTKTKMDECETSLHMAAACDDADEIFTLLIEKRADIDEIRNGKTALMIAVLFNFPSAVRCLFLFDPNIDVADGDGETALQMVLKMKDVHPDIVKEFMNVVKNQYSDTNQLIDKLFNAGCNLYHSAFLEDVEVMEGLVERGVKNVNKTYYKNRNALHVAAAEGNRLTVACLLKLGANVNGLDEDGQNALCLAAANGNSVMVQLLLERGADPNAKAYNYGLTPLIAAMENSSKEYESHYDKCVEILFLHGAIPTQKIGEHPTVFDEALDNGSFDRINMMICYVALLEMQGVSIAETMMKCNLEEHQYALPLFQEYFDKCQQTLKTKIFNSLTLLDLLSASDCKFRMYNRQESFFSTAYDALTADDLLIYRWHSYYHVSLMNRLWSTPDLELENEAMSSICQIFDCDYNQGYVFAREVVEYLNKRDLEVLCRM